LLRLSQERHRDLKGIDVANVLHDQLVPKLPAGEAAASKSFTSRIDSLPSSRPETCLEKVGSVHTSMANTSPGPIT